MRPSPNSDQAQTTGFGLISQAQVTTDGAGNWVAVWTSNESLGGLTGSEGDILVSRSTVAGVSWTDAAALNSDAASDSGFDFAPQVATDGAG